MINADVSMGGESLQERQFLIESYSFRVDRILLDITCILNTSAVDTIIRYSTASYDSFYPCLVSFGWCIRIGGSISDGQASMRRDSVQVNQLLQSGDMVAVARLKGHIFSRMLPRYIEPPHSYNAARTSLSYFQPLSALQGISVNSITKPVVSSKMPLPNTEAP